MDIYTIEDINEKYSNFGLKNLERFNKDVICEVKSLCTDLSQEDLSLYEDHTNKNIITIDGEKTQDIDDAIFLEKVGRFYSLTVYISDVSHYVKEGSKLDEEALKRGTSIYLPGKTLTMLPSKLSHDICSLKENKKRLTLAINMVYDKKGKLKSKRIFKAIISSKKKMTYKKVDKVLQNCDSKVNEEYSNFISQLFLMKDLALILRKKRYKNYFIELDIPEFEFYVPNSSEFEHISITPYEHNISNIIIEEFMLAANMTIAETFYKLVLPIIFRTHDTPHLSNINFKLKLNYKKAFGNREYLVKIIAKKIRKEKINKIPLSFNVLNSLTSAKYSDSPLGHFALNTKYYCHFTSPIRRYSDLYIHRLISEYIENGDVTLEMIYKYEELASDIAQKCSETEAFAKKVSREIENMYIALYMQDFIGEKFKATIYKFSKNHISIFINDVMVTGKIKISSISTLNSSISPTLYDNNLILDKNYILKIYDNLIVTLVGIDTSTNQLMFEIVEN